jgi:type III secretory pathway component EscS
MAYNKPVPDVIVRIVGNRTVRRVALWSSAIGLVVTLVMAITTLFTPGELGFYAAVIPFVMPVAFFGIFSLFVMVGSTSSLKPLRILWRTNWPLRILGVAILVSFFISFVPAFTNMQDVSKDGKYKFHDGMRRELTQCERDHNQRQFNRMFAGVGAWFCWVGLVVSLQTRRR